MLSNNDNFHKVLLVIKSVKGESWWQRRKVYKKVKEWRKNNSYQVVDYSYMKAKFQAQTYQDFQIGQYYTIKKSHYYYNNGSVYGKQVLLIKPQTFFFGEKGVELLNGDWIREDIASMLSAEATEEEMKEFNQKKSKLDAIQANIDQHESLMSQYRQQYDKVLQG